MVKISGSRGIAGLLAAVALAGCNVYGPGWSSVHSDGSNSDYSRIAAPADVTLAWEHAFGGRMQIIACSPQLDGRTEQQPVGAGFVERHPDAAGVDDACPADHAIELHVHVAADHQVDPERIE